MKRIVSLLLICIAFTSPIRAADKPPSNTVRALRVVQIKSNDDQDRIDGARQIQMMADDMLKKRFSGSLSNAMQFAADAVGLKPEDMIELVSISYDPSDPSATILVDLTHAPHGTKMCAAEAADRVVRTLNESLDPGKAQNDYVNARRSLEMMENRKDEFQKRIAECQKKLADQTGAVDVSASTLRQLLTSLQTQRESIQIDLAAKMERRDALAEQIARFSKEIETKVSADPVAAELEKVVEYHEKQLERNKELVQSKSISQGDADAAIAAAAEARAKLLERREQAAASAGGDIITSWNKDLMNLSVDLAELKARFATIDDRLHHFTGITDIIRVLDECDASSVDVNRQLTEMNRRADQMRNELDRHHMWLDTVSSKDDPAPATQPAAPK